MAWWCHMTSKIWVNIGSDKAIVWNNVGPLQWHHNEHDGISNHQPHDCLLNHLFRRRSKKIPKLHITGLCAGNSPVTGELPTQRASYAENVSIYVIMLSWMDYCRISMRAISQKVPRLAICQNRWVSARNAQELCLSCINPSKWV